MQPVSGPDPQLTDLFRQIRQDARSDPKPVDAPDLATIMIEFDGGGLPLVPGVVGRPLEVPFDCRIMGARLFVGTTDPAATLTIDVKVGTFLDYPHNVAIYDTIPTLTAAQKVELNVTSWPVRRLLRRDVIAYALTTVSGSPTYAALALWVRKIDKPTGSTGLVDGSGNPIDDGSGNSVIIR